MNKTPVVRPIAGRIGAEILDINLAEPLDESALETVRSALDAWKVVFFRDQKLDHASQIAFARQFGELTFAHPHDIPPGDYPEIYTVDDRRKSVRAGYDVKTRRVAARTLTTGWHTDVTAAVNPPAGSILRAEIVPEFGGDTTFTNLVAAYEGLTQPIRDFVDTLWAEHFYQANWAGYPQKISGDFEERVKTKDRLVAHHPVVRVHPRTGERALFINPGFTDHILDVSPVESRWILGHLFNEIIRPEYTCRFRWAPGSVAFWDNRATSHLAPKDLDHLDIVRVLHRVTLIGDVPVGVDGRSSELIEGVPFAQSPVFTTSS